MGATTTAAPCSVLVGRSRPLLALLLCFQLLHASQAFKLRGGAGHEEEKVPLAVIVPDPSPELSGSNNLPPAPLAAPPPVVGGGGDDMRPRLPTERWRRARGEVRRSAGGAAAHPPAASHDHDHDARAAPRTAPSASPGPASSSSRAGRGAPARAPTVAAGEAEAPAPAPESGSGGTAFIESSPAVPVPHGVTDTATILPMPAPGEKRQEEVAAATSVGAAGLVPLLLGLIAMMASFGL